MTKRSVQLKILDPRIGFFAICLLVSIIFVSAVRADGSRTLQGLVVGVLDGDTIDVLVDGRQSVRVRLAGIDAPEKSQDFGQLSKKSLSDLVYNKITIVQVTDTDRYGRTVGRVTVNGIDVNLEQVTRGLAWAFDRYVKDPRILAAHAQARIERRGLWGHPYPTAPWDFRRQDSAR